jgi:hypothetical protein
MKINRRTGQQLALGATLAIAVPFSGFFLAASAQTFNPPSGLGTPQRTAGGSRPVRSSCAASSQQAAFVALSPTRFKGLTASDHPTVWVAVPRTTAKTLEFSLFDAQQNGIYQTNVPIDSSTGMVRVSVPPTVAALISGQSYTWTAALVCNPQRRTEDWVATGTLHKQTPSAEFQRQVSKASSEQQVKLYAQAGYWYETINALAELRRSQPTHPKLATTWSDLLKIAGLPLVTPPVVTAHAHQ